MDILNINAIIAINQYIHEKEHSVNEVFVKEANRIWDRGETHITSYPFFIKVYTDLLWKEYLKLN